RSSRRSPAVPAWAWRRRARSSRRTAARSRCRASRAAGPNLPSNCRLLWGQVCNLPKPSKLQTCPHIFPRALLALMEALANLNGEVMPLAEAKVPALDRGFLFGDAVYEVLRVYAGRPWLEEEHFRRLAHSLEAIRIRGINVARLRRRMHET